MSKMLNFEAVVSAYGPKAVEYYSTYMEQDNKAIKSIEDSDIGGVVSWLHSYRVLQGFNSRERASIAEAVVRWAQASGSERDLTSSRLLDEAHKDMMKVCIEASGKDHNLISLASKALWLCYPQQVPIFDSFAHRTLCILSRLEEQIQPVPDGLSSKYGHFAHRWKHFFDTYADSINEIDMKSCRYPVRIFDTILWIIGEFPF